MTFLIIMQIYTSFLSGQLGYFMNLSIYRLWNFQERIAVRCNILYTKPIVLNTSKPTLILCLLILIEADTNLFPSANQEA